VDAEALREEVTPSTLTVSTRSKTWAAVSALGAAWYVATVAAPDAPGTKPGDDAMTCEQLATELAPYMQQMMPNLQAFGMSQQQLYQQGQQKSQQRQLEHAALTPLATAGALDPTGASKRAYQAAAMAQAAKDRAEDEATVNSPLAKQANAQGQQVADQAQQMQANARLRRLMQLGQQKGCTKR
jgi:hypothetical protein